MTTDPLETFRALLKLDTTNPPGHESPAAQLLADTLAPAGIEPTLLHAVPGRDNLVARLKGDGSAPPLLLHGHLDVVPAEPDRWTVPPFAAVEKDGWLYGRGAVDMKNMVAMCCHVLLALKEEGVRLKRDVIFAAVADEETGSGLGSRFLVDHHPDLVRAEYALGEVGAFPLDMGPVRYFPIMVAEKGAVRLTLTATGDPGHGSVPHAHQAVVHLARALAALSARRLPVRVTDPVRRFVEVLAATQPLPSRLVLPLLTSPTLAGPLVDKVLPAAVRPNFAAMLSNTATPTVLSAGGQVNVIPSTATARVDGRTLPGQTAADLVAQVRSRVGPHVGIQVDSQEPPLSFSPDTPLYAHLARVLRQADPACVPVPYMLSGFTDAKSWARLGTTCYGFAPTRFPPGSAVFGKLFHGHDERAHVEGFRWGFNVLRDAVRGWVT